MRFFILALSLISFLSFAAPVSVTVTGTTLCNNGSTERTVAGTMTTTCGDGWSVGALSGAATLYEQNFDAYADWTTTDRDNMTIPGDWDFGSTGEAWHPANGDVGSNPNMLINGDNPDQVYGGTGKAFITYSESETAAGGTWDSDAMLWKDFTPSSEVYVKFNIKFQNGWASDTDRGLIKVFRITHWDGIGGRTDFFSDGMNAPIYIWDWGQSDYGIRHTHAFRCDDQATNYYCSDPAILDPPIGLNSGSMSVNYTSSITGTDPQIPDLVNGGFIARTASPTMFHNNVWGDGWHKVEFHFKLNSAAGVQDGLFKYWLDGELVVDMSQIAWIGNGGDINAKWNGFSIGGNDDYPFDLVGTFAERERWYAIDNILIQNALPVEYQ